MHKIKLQTNCMTDSSLDALSLQARWEGEVNGKLCPVILCAEAWTHRNALSSETFFASSGSDISVSGNLSPGSSCKLSATYADEAAAIALFLPANFSKA